MLETVLVIELNVSATVEVGGSIFANDDTIPSTGGM
jgi:hypothetical protein